jgi:hypothetical protein
VDEEYYRVKSTKHYIYDGKNGVEYLLSKVYDELDEAQPSCGIY